MAITCVGSRYSGPAYLFSKKYRKNNIRFIVSSVFRAVHVVGPYAGTPRVVIFLPEEVLLSGTPTIGFSAAAGGTPPAARNWKMD